jgi:hypothetical protein
MKKIAFFLIFNFAFLFHSKSQNYIAIPDSGAKWINHNFIYPPNTPQSFYYIYTTNGTDTTINSINYFKLIWNTNDPYYGAMRNDSGKVFILPKDSLNEYLAYDFTANVGDTIFNVYKDAGAYTLYSGIENVVIEYLSTVDLGDGILRKQLQTQNGKLWIEGIGSTYGLFSEDSLNVSNYGSALSCFSIGNTSLYPTYANVVCEMGVGLSSINENRNLLAYPNPTNAIFMIETKQDIKQFCVYDALLRKIEIPIQLTKNKLILNTESLMNGHYFVEILTANERFMQKMIVVHDIQK